MSESKLQKCPKGHQFTPTETEWVYTNEEDPTRKLKCPHCEEVFYPLGVQRIPKRLEEERK